MTELGQPEQLPRNCTLTTPFLNSINFISPPSLATAGLIFVSNILIICFSTSLRFSVFIIDGFLSIIISLPFA